MSQTKTEPHSSRRPLLICLAGFGVALLLVFGTAWATATFSGPASAPAPAPPAVEGLRWEKVASKVIRTFRAVDTEHGYVLYQTHMGFQVVPLRGWEPKGEGK